MSNPDNPNVAGIWTVTTAAGMTGTYWVSQLEDDTVWWVGMSSDGTSWCNVFSGQLGEVPGNLNVVFGKWVDVPKGGGNASGQVCLTIIDDNNMVISPESTTDPPTEGWPPTTGGFDSNNWKRSS